MDITILRYSCCRSYPILLHNVGSLPIQIATHFSSRGMCRPRPSKGQSGKNPTGRDSNPGHLDAKYLLTSSTLVIQMFSKTEKHINECSWWIFTITLRTIILVLAIVGYFLSLLKFNYWRKKSCRIEEVKLFLLQ